jgi:2',3'-cyclic-nucleotide 2'-phosphodiesterase (5'-nucleotidase family)
VFREAVGADVGFINGGTIRSNTQYGPGNLRKRDVLSILPFENSICSVRLTGAELRAALEHGVANVGKKADGRFPQVSGMRFEYDAARPVGKRVTGVWLTHRDTHDPLEDGKSYTVAINSYLAHGGDGYRVFLEAQPVIRPENGTDESIALFRAMQKIGTIAPLVRGRIVRKDHP